MPFYEHECKEHGVYSIFCSMSDHRDMEPCPDCKKMNPTRLGAPNFKWGKGMPPPTELGKIQEALKKPPTFDAEREKEVKEL